MIEYTGPPSVKKCKEAVCSPSRMHHQIETLCSLEGHTVKDRRVSPSIKMPLSEFITPLLEKRKAYQRKMKGLSRESEEYRKWDLRQRGLKGTIHTLYGTMASPCRE